MSRQEVHVGIVGIDDTEKSFKNINIQIKGAFYKQKKYKCTYAEELFPINC